MGATVYIDCRNIGLTYKVAAKCHKTLQPMYADKVWLDSWMNDWTHVEMPRAFLVKNKQRRSTTVDDNSHATTTRMRHLTDFDSGKLPTQLQNFGGRCSVAEHEREKNRRTIEFTAHRAQSDVRHEDQSQG